MYYITEFVRFVCENETYQIPIPETYKTFLKLVTKHFKSLLTSSYRLYYENKQKQTIFISNEQDFAQIQDTGFKVIVIFIIAKPFPVIPDNLFSSGLKSIDNSLPDRPIRKGSAPELEEIKENRSLISSVYKVHDSNRRFCKPKYHTIKEEDDKQGIIISGVYSCPDMNEGEEGPYMEVSKALRDSSSMALSKMKGFFQDFKKGKNGKKENVVGSKVLNGNGYYELINVDEGDKKEIGIELEGINQVQEKGSSSNSENGSPVAIKQGIIKKNHSLKSNLKSWFKIESFS